MQIESGFTKGVRVGNEIKLSLFDVEYFRGSIERATTLLEDMEPLMKKRSNFLYSSETFTLRSYDVKDAVRVLRKIT